MAVDLLLRGGTVVDGTGAPARAADVAVRNGRIVAVGADASAQAATRVIDVAGRVVAPGFVDLHTHYDAQLLWDPTASPSSRHGVTTIFGGNCGFGLAPVAPEHSEYLARLMARVEGIPLPALEAGVPWSWTTFGDYLDCVDRGGVAVNAGFLAGHCALRRLAMGEHATGGAATEDQIATMAAMLRAALDAGAFGFSSSQAPTHNDGNGDPVPSRFASKAELVALAGELGPYAGTQLELIIAGCLNGFTDAEVDLMVDLCRAADSPLNWNVLGVSATGNHEHQLAASSRAAERGARVVALTIPQSMRIRLSFLTGFVLDGLPGWAEVLGRPVPERLRLLADPAVRARLDEGAHSEAAGVLAGLARWDRFTIVEGFTAETRAYEGRTVGDIATRENRAPFDVLLDVVVADELRTGLRPELPAEDDATWQARAAVWRDPRAVVGASDAGAHLDMFCMAGYSTFLVGPAVRELGLLTLEEAVRLLTDVPARLYGLDGRGRIDVGAHADLAIFDPASVGPGREHTVDDLPGGSSRIVVESVGMEQVLVAGTPIVVDGELTGATPGRVLRRGTTA
ncbi:MAG: N-acyl-D-amino-acid deacylase family protein [Acidimicrobiia bacterium]